MAEDLHPPGATELTQSIGVASSPPGQTCPSFPREFNLGFWYRAIEITTADQPYEFLWMQLIASGAASILHRHRALNLEALKLAIAANLSMR
jgi:hypothetical protein